MIRAIATMTALMATLSWGAQVVLSDQEQMSCDTQGGCVFVTLEALKSKMRSAYEAGVKEGARECRKLTT